MAWDCEQNNPHCSFSQYTHRPIPVVIGTIDQEHNQDFAK